jgi:hypothetical protein
LDEHPDAESFKLSSGIDARMLAERVGLGDRASFAYRANTFCALSHADQQTAAEVGDIYQRMFLRSRNFDNFLDGQVYYKSKPPHVLDPHPKFDSYTAIAKAIRRDFNLGSAYFIFVGKREMTNENTVNSHDFRQQNNGTIDEIVSFYRDVRFQRNLGGAVRLRQPITGYAETATGVHFAVLPTFDVSIRGSPVEGVLVVWSTSAIELVAYKAASNWLRDFSARKHLDKARFLKNLRRETQNELNSTARAESGMPGRKARQQSIRRIGKFLCEAVCELTNGEACSFRMKHDTRRIVRQYGRYATPLGQDDPNVVKKRQSQDIRVDEWQTSAIAFAFHFCAQDQIIYIDDMDRLPMRYAAAGLQSVRKNRLDTRCELIVRICRGGLLTAAINVESPIQHALWIDQDFLTDCGSIIDDYLSRLEVIGDWAGLATMATTQLEIHSIKSQLLAWKPERANDAVAIVQRLKERLPKVSAPEDRLQSTGNYSDSVTEFNTAMLQRFGNWLTDTGSEVRTEDVLNGLVPQDFPRVALPSLEVIFDSIWSNMISHAPFEKNRLTFAAADQSFGKPRLLTIVWTSPSKVPGTIDLDKFLLQPIVDRKGPHFGFFLIGVHSRLLGGHVEFSQQKRTAGFSLRAYIPYESA